MLNVVQLAALAGWSTRTAWRYLAAWAAAQNNPAVPRVTTVRTGRRGRPRHEVQRADFERWSLRQPVSVAA